MVSYFRFYSDVYILSFYVLYNCLKKTFIFVFMQLNFNFNIKLKLWINILRLSHIIPCPHLNGFIIILDSTHLKSIFKHFFIKV